MTCYVVETKKGNVARVHGEPTDDPKTKKAIEAVIDAAVKQFMEKKNG